MSVLGDTFTGVSYGCVWESEREVHLECIFPICFSLVTHWHQPRCNDTADLCKGIAHKHPLTWLIFHEKLLSWSWRSCKHHAVCETVASAYTGCAWQIVPVGRKLRESHLKTHCWASGSGGLAGLRWTYWPQDAAWPVTAAKQGRSWHFILWTRVTQPFSGRNSNGAKKGNSDYLAVQGKTACLPPESNKN